MLAGKGEVVQQVLPVRNQASDPKNHFLMDPVGMEAAQQQMDDDYQDDAMRPKDGEALQVLEALLQSGLQIQTLEYRHKDNHASKRCELLVFETDNRHLVKTGQNCLFAELHLRCPPEVGSVLSFTTSSISNLQRRRK